MKPIEFLSGGQRVVGSLDMPDRPTGQAVLLMHGMTSNQKKYMPMAAALAEHGIVGMAIDLRGHGESGGDFNSLVATDGLSDALAAYDFLASQSEVDSSRIGVCGASFGGMLAALVTSERLVKSLVLRVPAAYTDDMMHMPYADIMADQNDIFFKIADPATETSAVRAMHTFTGSLLAISSELDDIIAPAIPQAYFDTATQAARREKEEMKAAPHPLNTEKLLQQFTDRMVRWFSETL